MLMRLGEKFGNDAEKAEVIKEVLNEHLLQKPLIDA
jgi:hypothetical protein